MICGGENRRAWKSCDPADSARHAASSSTSFPSSFPFASSRWFVKRTNPQGFTDDSKEPVVFEINNLSVFEIYDCFSILPWNFYLFDRKYGSRLLNNNSHLFRKCKSWIIRGNQLPTKYRSTGERRSSFLRLSQNTGELQSSLWTRLYPCFVNPIDCTSLDNRP